MLLSRDRLNIVNILQIFGRTSLACKIIRVRTCLLGAAERNELLIYNLQVAHVI